MKNVTTSILAPIQESQSLDIQQKPNGAFEFKSYQEFMDMLKRMSESIENYEYNEEDRSAIHKFGAEFNKIKKRIKDEMKQYEEHAFGELKRQQKEVDASLTELRAKMIAKREEQDERDKNARYEMLVDVFEDMKFNSKHLQDDDFEIERIFDSAWLNRSASENKVVEELSQKVSSIDAVRGSGELPQAVETSVIIQALIQNSYDGLRAIQQIKDDIVARKEAEERRRIEEEVRKQREIELQKEREQGKITEKDYENIQRISTVNIEIMQKDLEDVKSLLEEHNIGFKVL